MSRLLIDDIYLKKFIHIFLKRHNSSMQVKHLKIKKLISINLLKKRSSRPNNFDKVRVGLLRRIYVIEFLISF